MKRLGLGLLLFLGIFQWATAQWVEVGDSAKISLLTCSPGKDAYSVFGHTAIRYQDSSNGMDMVFNYGIFNFDQEGFYIKFIKGATFYMLGMYDTNYFLEEYRHSNRTVISQELRITKGQKQELINRLMLNGLPENKYYLYNFIYDNCATRPRDELIRLVEDKKIKFDYPSEEHTFRDWIEAYTGEDTWLKFGIDLVLGKRADHNATHWQSMFLPEVLSQEFGAIHYTDTVGENKPLLAPKEVLVVAHTVQKRMESKFVKPIFVSSYLLLLVIIFTIIGYYKRRQYQAIDFLLYLITGIAGVIIFYLMFFSIHPLVKSNINILWCNPFYLIVAILILIRRLDRFTQFIQLGIIILLLLVLVANATSFQVINTAFLPLIVAMLIRSIYWIYAYRRFKR